MFQEYLDSGKKKNRVRSFCEEPATLDDETCRAQDVSKGVDWKGMYFCWFRWLSFKFYVPFLLQWFGFVVWLLIDLLSVFFDTTPVVMVSFWNLYLTWHFSLKCVLFDLHWMIDFYSVAFSSSRLGWLQLKRKEKRASSRRDQRITDELPNPRRESRALVLKRAEGQRKTRSFQGRKARLWYQRERNLREKTCCQWCPIPSDHARIGWKEGGRGKAYQ